MRTRRSGSNLLVKQLGLLAWPSGDGDECEIEMRTQEAQQLSLLACLLGRERAEVALTCWESSSACWRGHKEAEMSVK